MPIYRRESGVANPMTPHLFNGEAKVWLNDNGTVVPIHRIHRIFEGFEHNDLATHYFGDGFAAYDIQSNIVRSGNYALRRDPDEGGIERIFMERSEIDVPVAGDAFRVWFYFDGDISLERDFRFDFAHGDDLVELNGGYQWELIDDKIQLRIYDTDGNRDEVHDFHFQKSAVPNNEWIAVNIYWNVENITNFTEHDIGWELIVNDSVKFEDYTSDSRYPNRDGIYWKIVCAQTDIPVYTDDVEYI